MDKYKFYDEITEIFDRAVNDLNAEDYNWLLKVVVEDIREQEEQENE